MQVGDPFAEKVLIECTLEVFHAGLVVGIQDLGGAGLSCATSELASAGDGGMHIVLDNVPLRAEGMTPAEILSSESQERMCAVVTPDKVDAFLAVCAKWEVQADVIGEVTDVRPAHHRVPGRDRAGRAAPLGRARRAGVPAAGRPAGSGRTRCRPTPLPSLDRPAAGELRELILRMIASPNLCSRAWVTDQYDRYVRGNTVLAQPADAGIVRVAETEDGPERGLAMATDCSGRYTLLDPYAGAQLALAEAYRNVVTTGAVPLAVTDCLNFGSPEDPAVMWQFEQAVRGLADGCAQLGIPVTGGNVSLYNQTAGVNILPTPVVGVLGVLDDVRRRTIPGIGQDTGETLLLLGVTRDEFDGSAWADVVHGHLGGRPPAVDLEAERLLGEILVAGSRDGMISAAHDVSEGGLVQTLVEMCISGAIRGADRAAHRRRRRRRVPAAVLRVHRPGRGGRAAHRGAAVHRDVHGAPAALGEDRRRRPRRHRRPRGTAAGHPGCRHDRAVRAAGSLGGHAAPSLRLTDVIRYSVGPRRRPDRRPVHRPGPGRPAAARVERRRPAVARAIPRLTDCARARRRKSARAGVAGSARQASDHG